MSLNSVALMTILGFVLYPFQTSSGEEVPTRRVFETGSGMESSRVTHSPDGKMLAIACGDESFQAEIRIFSTKTGKRILGIDPGCVGITELTFSPDSRSILACSLDGKSKVFDTKTGDSILELPEHKEGFLSGRFSPDGKQIAICHSDSALTIYARKDGKKLHEFKKEKQQFRNFAFLPDCRIAVVGSSSKVVIFSTSPKVPTKELDPKCGELNCVAVLPNGKQLLACSNEGKTVLLDIESGLDRATWSMGENKPLVLAIRSDGKQAAIATFSGEIVIYALDEDARVTQMNLNAHRLPATALSYSRDGKKLFTISAVEKNAIEWGKLPD